MGPQSKIPYTGHFVSFCELPYKAQAIQTHCMCLKTERARLSLYVTVRPKKRVITDDEKRAMVHHLQLLQRNFAETSDWSATIEDGLAQSRLSIISMFREFSKRGSSARNEDGLVVSRTG